MTGDSQAWSALRAAQTTFASQRQAGFQKLNIRDTVKAALGDTVVVDNTSTVTGELPSLYLPKLAAADTGRMIIVIAGKNTPVAKYQVTATDQIIANSSTFGASTFNTMTLGTGSPAATAHTYLAVGPGYGWRLLTSI